MAYPFSLLLTPVQMQELEQVRDHHPLAYVRVKAAGILKVRQGQSLRQVAKNGLLKPVRRETVKAWIVRYQQEGVAGLLVQLGRGRKPAFSPLQLDAQAAAVQVQEVVYRAPRLYGLQRGNWRLTDLRQVVEWLRPLSLPGVCRLLHRLQIVYKRGRASVHSPDLAYDQKLAVIAQARQRSQADPERFPFLYEDEMTYQLRPRVSRAYARRGQDAKLARQAPTAEQRRIAASLEVNTGAVIARQRSRFNVKEMYRYFRLVEKRYPQAERVTIALDNWPVHFHPFVLEELAKRHSRIELLPLPTYAPWTNPTEKLWGLLVKDELNQHAFVEDWSGLKQAVTAWFTQYEHGSTALLHAVGLCPD